MHTTRMRMKYASSYWSSANSKWIMNPSIRRRRRLPLHSHNKCGEVDERCARAQCKMHLRVIFFFFIIAFAFSFISFFLCNFLFINIVEEKKNAFYALAPCWSATSSRSFCKRGQKRPKKLISLMIFCFCFSWIEKGEQTYDTRIRLGCLAKWQYK